MNWEEKGVDVTDIHSGIKLKPLLVPLADDLTQRALGVRAELQLPSVIGELAPPPRRVPELLFVPDAVPGRAIEIISTARLRIRVYDEWD